VVELETRMNEELRGITGFSALSLTFDPPDLIDSLKALRIRISEETGLPQNPAEELGQGLQSAVVIALVRAYQRMQKSDPILLIEEPEAYLHPQARRSYREVLSRISGGGSCQVLCTTHSTEFIDLVYPEEVYSVRKRPTEGTRVSRGDRLVGVRPGAAQIKLATEFNPGVKEIVFSRCAILTEGPSEEWAITEGLRRAGRNPDSEGISVRNVGSKENLPFFLEVATSLGIPVVAVFDSDEGTPPTAAYHQALNQRIEHAAGGPAHCWVSSPDFETAHAIPSIDRSKPRSALAWAQTMSPTEANRVFGPVTTALRAVGVQPPPVRGSPPAAPT
jgi:putative ATP-dependent endonuclease of the OLD family